MLRRGRKDRAASARFEHRAFYVGDQLLVAVASRLASLVRSGDTLARFAGDEFVVLCEDVRSPADTDVLAGRLSAAFAAPFRLADREVAIDLREPLETGS